MRFLIVILGFALPASCTDKPSTPSDTSIFSPAKRLTELTEKKLEEVSGLAASSRNPGLLWTHNDSGNGAVVYLVDEQLTIRLACKIEGVRNRDWEDITVGPGPVEGKQYVYVADIGDNQAKYPVKFVYRFEEPLLDPQKSTISITDYETIVFRLEDEKKDTEAIMIDPATKDLYFVSKREKPVYLYQLKYPYAVSDTLTAARVASLPLTQIVAGNISADGKEILMKNYDNIYYWQVAGKSVIEALRETPRVLEYKSEPQGEAIAFARDGGGFFTLSEKINGEKTFLYFYERQ